MIQIKKTILTLVALLAVTTGAWADQLASSYSSDATLNEVTVSASMEVTIATGVTVTINNGLNITSGTLTVKGPGTLVVNGKAGSNGGYSALSNGGNGTPGSAAITGNIIVQGGATVKATGGNGGNGGNSGSETGGNGAQGGAAITGEVTIQDASTLEATGGNGGNGGNGDDGGNGGNGGVAFAGTLTYKGGTVTADGGNGGSGGWGDMDEGYGPSGSAGKAFTTSVNFVSSDYILTDGSNAITATQVTSKKKVVISPKVAVNSVTLAPTSATLTLGDYVALTATIDPTNAMDPTVKWNVTAGAEKVKLYKDENCSTEVGTAATDLLTVYAKGLAVGEATVTVTSNDDATKTAACTVTVIQPGPKVAWNKAEKTGKFTMPGGNVTLEPDYYPQAALTAAPTAINDVPATTDGAIVKAGTVANIGSTETAQGTVMYYVSPTALDDAALLALAADKWTADVPTAEKLTKGEAYVYYYVRGNDSDTDEENFSDGDILAANALTVTIAAEPTKVTLAANDKTMGIVEVAGESKVEWTADTWKGWTADIKEHTVDDITITGTQKTSIYELTSEDKYKNSLLFFVVKVWDNSTVTFSTTGDPFSRIEFTMIDDYSQYNPNIIPNDNWTVEGKSAVWEGEATKSLTLQSCSTQVSKITFFKGATPDGVTINGDGTFTVAKTATVTLKATPAEGYKFLYWEDDQTNTNPVREVTIESGMADMTYKAVFAEITYNVTFAEGTDPNEWTADPNADVKKGQTVTVTYTGSKKVIGVKAEKKAAEPVLLTTITAADNSSFKSGSQTFGDVATVTLTGDYLINDGSHGGWYCQGSNKTATISVAAANGANITSVKFYTAGGGSAEDKDAPFEVTTTTVTSSDITTYLNGNSIGSYGVSKIEVYGTK